MKQLTENGEPSSIPNQRLTHGAKSDIQGISLGKVSAGGRFNCSASFSTTEYSGLSDDQNTSYVVLSHS